MTQKQLEKYQKKAAIIPKEDVIHRQVCKYLDYNYPTVIYTSDASGVRMPMGLAVKFGALRAKNWKIPDLIILHPNKTYHGLIIELKRSYSEVFKLDGKMRKNEHIEQQAAALAQLSGIGYKAEFGFGLDHSIAIINEYFTR